MILKLSSSSRWMIVTVRLFKFSLIFVDIEMTSKQSNSTEKENNKKSHILVLQTKTKWIITLSIILIASAILFVLHSSNDENTKYTCNKRGISYARSSDHIIIITIRSRWIIQSGKVSYTHCHSFGRYIVGFFHHSCRNVQQRGWNGYIQ